MFEKYIEHLRDEGKAENTINSYISDLKIFFSDNNLSPTSIVTAADIRKWIQRHLKTDQRMHTTVNRRINSLKGYFTWAYNNKRVITNPMNDIGIVKVADEESESIQWLTESEFEDLLKRMRDAPDVKGWDPELRYRRDRIAVYILTYLGLRVSELSNLKVNDIDMALRKVRIIGKGSVVRTLPINNLLYQELRDWLHYRSKMCEFRKDLGSGYLLFSQKSDRVSDRGIQRILERYDTDERQLHPHIFRHTFCMWMLKANNNDIVLVKRLAGHKDIRTTERYLKLAY